MITVSLVIMLSFKDITQLLTIFPTHTVHTSDSLILHPEVCLSQSPLSISYLLSPLSPLATTCLFSVFTSRISILLC